MLLDLDIDETSIEHVSSALYTNEQKEERIIKKSTSESQLENEFKSINISEFLGYLIDQKAYLKISAHTKALKDFKCPTIKNDDKYGLVSCDFVVEKGVTQIHKYIKHLKNKFHSSNQNDIRYLSNEFTSPQPSESKEFIQSIIKSLSGVRN